jgi:hypothetical protein
MLQQMGNSTIRPNAEISGAGSIEAEPMSYIPNIKTDIRESYCKDEGGGHHEHQVPL